MDKFLHLTQCIVKKTFETSKETKNEAVIQIKRNQKALLLEVQGIIEEQECLSSFKQRIKKGHGRAISRQYKVYEIPEYRGKALRKWKDVKYIIEVKRTRKKFDTRRKRYKESSQITAYYASTTLNNAKKFSDIIEGHWGIENRNHCVKDITFNEDKSRIRVNPMIFAILRSWALNILRFNNVENIAEARDRNKMNIHYIFNYKGVA